MSKAATLSMPFADAARLVNGGLDAIPDAKLIRCWHSYASKISYHLADDSGHEWEQARALRPTLNAITIEIQRRGLDMPSRAEYLL